MTKQLYKAVYRERRTFLKYDENHVIIYPNETVIENYLPESEGDSKTEPCTGYQYEGAEHDGGYIVECQDANNLHDLANAIVRSRYSLSEEIALQRHYQTDPDDYADRWQEYCEFADGAADKARLWLGIALN